MKILALDSLLWEELTHAYGNAGDIPALLELSETAVGAGSYDAQPWYKLWSSLCHQGDVYSASLAACPHLMRVAEMREGTEKIELVLLLASILLEVELKGIPNAPKEVMDAYLVCVGKASSLLSSALNDVTDRSYVTAILGAIAAINGQSQIGDELANADPLQECPKCEAVFPRYYDLDENYVG